MYTLAVIISVYINNDCMTYVCTYNSISKSIVGKNLCYSFDLKKETQKLAARASVDMSYLSCMQ